jgi:O-antigen ligase
MTAAATTRGTVSLAPPRNPWIPWQPFAPLLALPALGFDAEGIQRVIVAMELIFLVMAVRQPYWALAALLLSELTIRNYFLAFGGFEITARLFITLASVLILVPHVTKGLKLGPQAKGLGLAALAFVALTTVSNGLNTDLGTMFTFLRYIATGVATMVIVPQAITQRSDLLKVCTIGLGVAAASTLAAVAQHYEFQALPVIEVQHGLIDRSLGRSVGLSENPIYLSTDVMVFLFPLLAVVLTRAVSSKTAQGLTALMALMVAALWFSETRSWVPSAVMALAAMAFILPWRTQRDLVVLLLVGVSVFLAIFMYTGSRYSNSFGDDDSAAARPVLWTAAKDIAVDNPVLGIGHNRFEEVSVTYMTSIDPQLLANQEAFEVLGKYEPHNDLLNVWSSFGTGAVIAFALVFWFTARNFMMAAKEFLDPLLRGISLGCLGALAAVFVNSMFHNFYDSTLTLWVLAGLSLAMTKLASAEAPLKKPMP